LCLNMNFGQNLDVTCEKNLRESGILRAPWGAPCMWKYNEEGYFSNMFTKQKSDGSYRWILNLKSLHNIRNNQNSAVKRPLPCNRSSFFSFFFIIVVFNSSLSLVLEDYLMSLYVAASSGYSCSTCYSSSIC
jgi:hypothetical protein